MSTSIISTHTLTWSVTLKLDNINKKKIISTHTLTWSVTLVLAVNLLVSGNFNSHAHVERDAKNYKKLSVNVISTHTLTWSVTQIRYLRL